MKKPIAIVLACAAWPLASCQPLTTAQPATARPALSSSANQMLGGFVGHPAAITPGLRSSP